MKEKLQGPGPGAYARFSDFSGIEKVPAAEEIGKQNTRSPHREKREYRMGK